MFITLNSMFKRKDEWLLPRMKCLRERMNAYNIEYWIVCLGERMNDYYPEWNV